MTVPGPLPYIGFAPELGSGVDQEFLWPDRTIGYLQTMAPPGIWTVVGDQYPCQARRAMFLASGVSEDPPVWNDLIRSNETVSADGSGTTAIDNTSGDVLFGKFFSAPVQFSEILAGVWEIAFAYDLYPGTDGDTRMFFEVGKIEPDTTETILFSDQSEVLQPAGGAGIKVKGLWKFDVPSGMTFAAGDALFVKVYFRTLATFAIVGLTWDYPTLPAYVATPFVSPVFATPTADGAPWTLIGGQSVLTEYPEAADVLGFLITDIDGLDSTLSRNVTRKSIGLGGGILEREHAGPRTVTVKGVMVSLSSCGLEWGERWLQHVLAAPPCDPCSDTGYSFRECCPPDEETGLYGYTGFWSIYDVGTLSGPIIRPLSVVDANPTDLVRQSCYMAEFEFTIGSEDPYLFKPWKVVDEGWDCVPFTDYNRLGINGVIVSFGNSSSGSLSVRRFDCDADPVELFTFAFLDPGSVLYYDSARQRAFVVDIEGRVLDALAFGFLTTTDGLPLEWFEQDSECFNAGCLCPAGNGSGATVYIQHKEPG